MPARTRLGFLYPGSAAEDDLPALVDAWFPNGSVAAEVVHTTIGEDAHTVAALTETGHPERLAEGAGELVTRKANVAIWACTSGSFVFGWKGAHRQAELLSRSFGGPASSTSLAFVHAARALDVRRVAVAATYPAALTKQFLRLLDEAGLEVVAGSNRGIQSAAEVGGIGHGEVVRLVVDGDHPDADAILIPDTALHTVSRLDELQAAVSKHLLTANQVSVWEALRLTGALGRDQSHRILRGAGTL